MRNIFNYLMLGWSIPVIYLTAMKPGDVSALPYAITVIGLIIALIWNMAADTKEG